MEARKALVVPTKRRKNNSDGEDKKNDPDTTNLDSPDIDEEVVENIFDQIMGDEESSTSSVDELKPETEVTKASSTKVCKKKLVKTHNSKNYFRKRIENS